jgi:hypothetical protein
MELAAEESQAFIPAPGGETLSEIAAGYSLDEVALAQSNSGLSGATVPAGTQIIVPSALQVDEPEEQPPAELQVDQGPALALANAQLLQVDASRLELDNLVLFAAGRDQNRPVAAPTNLQVEVQDCQVLLSWDDNADNELGYAVWMWDFRLPGRRVANLQPSASTGKVWFQLDTPPAGPYGFWVTAANWLGAKESEIAWVRVENNNCSSRTARDLEFELVLFDTIGSWNRLYCYVSVEGRPEERVPAGRDTFFYSTGFGPNQPTRKTLLPIPADDSLQLEGTCHQIVGNYPFELSAEIGSFSEDIGKELWDGHAHPIDMGSSTLWYTIQPLGSLTSLGQYAYIDSTIPQPTNLAERAAGLSVTPTDPRFDPERLFSWDWSGSQEITGFNVFVNGVVVEHVGPGVRHAVVWLPARCGSTFTLGVAATRGKQQSITSELVRSQDPCPIEATVEFLELNLTGADDTVDPLINPDFGVGCSGDLEVYFTLAAVFDGKIESRTYFGASSPLKPNLICGRYDFPVLVVGSPYHRYGPPPEAVKFTGLIGANSSGTANVGVRVAMHDQDEFWDDVIVNFFTYAVNSVENWRTYDETEEIPFNNFPDASGSITFRIRGRTLEP